MLIEITYNVTDVFMSTTETPVYVEISFEQPSGSAAVWGSITGTLSNQTDLQNALNLKVPYTGATTNVNLGEYELKAGQVTLDTSPTGTAAVGTIRWNDTTGTSETTLKGGNVIIKNGVDLVARVVNKVSPNTTLTKAAYQAVRVSGAQGQRLAVAFAQANNDANSADTIGIVIETIPTNQEGFIMTVGQLEGINTTGSLQGETWVDGDVLYLSPTTAGAITNVKPTGATGHLVIIGYVEYAHANNGKIYVKVMNGWELDELHNVSIVTPTNNQGLFYNSSNSLWENKSITTVLGYTPVPTTRNITINGVTYDLSADRTWTIAAGISGSGAAGQVTYWTGASAVSGSNNLFWDNANSRLGIGTNAPSSILDIQPSTGSPTFRIARNSGADFRIGSSTLAIGALIGTYSAAPISLVANSATVGTITSGGNFILGVSTDNGQRLQVYGDTLLRGSGATSATTALTVQNSDSANLFRVLNNGQINLGNSASFPYIRTVVSDFTQTPTGTKVIFGTQDTTTGNGSFLFGSNTLAHTTGTVTYVQLLRDFTPTSGTGSTTHLLLNGAINQTGGANGITRGLYVNPTLTAAADFRAIETSAGNVLFGSNFFWDNANGRLGIGTNAPAYKLDVSGDARINNTTQFIFDTTRLQISTTGVSGFYGNNFINWSSSTNYTLQRQGGTVGIRINSTDNVSIGATTDGGQKFQVYGDTLLRGSGATSATTALTVQNSSSTNLFTVRNDGNVGIGTASPISRLHINGTGTLANFGTIATNGVVISTNANGTGLITAWNYDVAAPSSTSIAASAVLGFNGSANNFYGVGIGEIRSSAYDIWFQTGATNGGGYRFYKGVTEMFTIYSNGNVGIGTGAITTTSLFNLSASTTAKAHINLAAGVAPTSPVNGDIWFDGTDIKMRIGGVTKTFTLI